MGDIVAVLPQLPLETGHICRCFSDSSSSETMLLPSSALPRSLFVYWQNARLALF